MTPATLQPTMPALLSRLALAFSLFVAAAATAAPEPASVRDFDWYDATRNRAVPVRLYWPAGEQAVSLVVFSHGIGGSRRGYSYLGEHFASHGIASLHLQHVGSDRSVWTGNPFVLIARLHEAAEEREALDRVRDPRIKAAVLLSAPPFYGEDDPKKILRTLTLPTLHVTATEDVIQIPGYYSPASDRVAVFEATGSALKALAVFEGGSHRMFTNRPGTGGVTLNPQVKAATKELALAFLQRVFEGRDEALARWPQAHAAILARWVGAQSR